MTIPSEILATVRRCVRWLRRHHPLPAPYRVRVIILPRHDCLEGVGRNGSAGWACFYLNTRTMRPKRARIYLPLRWTVSGATGLPTDKIIPQLCDLVCHEWVHALQWSTGKPLNERGVNARAMAWSRAFRRSA